MKYLLRNKCFVDIYLLINEIFRFQLIIHQRNNWLKFLLRFCGISFLFQDEGNFSGTNSKPGLLNKEDDRYILTKVQNNSIIIKLLFRFSNILMLLKLAACLAVALLLRQGSLNNTACISQANFFLKSFYWDLLYYIYSITV